MTAMAVDSIGIETLTVTVANVEQQMAARSVWKSMTDRLHKNQLLDQRIVKVGKVLDILKYNPILEEQSIPAFLESLGKLREAILGVLSNPRFPRREKLQALLPEIDDVIENLNDSINEDLIRAIHEADS